MNAIHFIFQLFFLSRFVCIFNIPIARNEHERPFADSLDNNKTRKLFQINQYVENLY